MNHEAVYRTILATRGLLIIYLSFSEFTAAKKFNNHNTFLCFTICTVAY